MQIRIIVTGAEDVQRFFNNIRSNLLPRVVYPEMKDEANDIKTEMQVRMHKRSGNMFNNTRVQGSPPNMKVVVGVNYAEEENRRAGLKRKNSQGSGQGTPHRFVEPSMELIDKMRLMPFMQRLDAFLRSS